MPSKANVFINDKDKPANIPNYETIITHCFDLGPRQATDINISGVRITLDQRSDTDNEVSDIWVKHGGRISMSEAETQRFVVQYLEYSIPTVRAPRVYLAFTWGDFGYIVGDGQMCGKSDIPLVAAAVYYNPLSPSRTPAQSLDPLVEA